MFGNAIDVPPTTDTYAANTTYTEPHAADRL